MIWLLEFHPDCGLNCNLDSAQILASVNVPDLTFTGNA